MEKKLLAGIQAFEKLRTDTVNPLLLTGWMLILNAAAAFRFRLNLGKPSRKRTHRKPRSFVHSGAFLFLNIS